ncbi:Ig-like domain-containing protein [Brevibacillus parabrevis]|uniref:Ig-like domain-containing protein n=1 Tax=Brevibacillus parabrevis TaxID=54914 RepID=UPI003D246F32
MTGVENGTAKKASALGLPKEVEVTLDEGTTLWVSVKWDVADSEYNPNRTRKQTFTVTGELVKLPKGVSNSQN